MSRPSFTIETNLYPEVAPDLNVAELDVVQDAAGPGRRLVVWLQGCAKRCAGCANQSFLPFRPACRLAPATILAAAHATGVEGITLSGGEPLLQAQPLVSLLETAQREGLNVVCYSGYRLEELRAEPFLVERVLPHLDLLIDGEYIPSLPRAGAYRPTSNQRVHRLSDAFRDRPLDGRIETQFRIGDQSTVTGTMPLAPFRELGRRLAEHGILIQLRPGRADASDVADGMPPPGSRGS